LSGKNVKLGSNGNNGELTSLLTREITVGSVSSLLLLPPANFPDSAFEYNVYLTTPKKLASEVLRRPRLMQL
jgi:hypothetical protein